MCKPYYREYVLVQKFFPELWPCRLRNFDTIQYASCHRNSSDMVFWMYMEVGLLLEPHMQMSMKIGCSGLLSFSRLTAP